MGIRIIQESIKKFTKRPAEQPEETSCYVCKTPFDRNERGQPLFALAYYDKANGYVKMCSPCVIDRKRNMGFYRDGRYVGPEAMKHMFQPFIPPATRSKTSTAKDA